MCPNCKREESLRKKEYYQKVGRVRYLRKVGRTEEAEYLEFLNRRGLDYEN